MEDTDIRLGKYRTKGNAYVDVLCEIPSIDHAFYGVFYRKLSDTVQRLLPVFIAPAGIVVDASVVSVCDWQDLWCAHGIDELEQFIGCDTKRLRLDEVTVGQFCDVLAAAILSATK